MKFLTPTKVFAFVFAAHNAGSFLGCRSASSNVKDYSTTLKETCEKFQTDSVSKLNAQTAEMVDQAVKQTMEHMCKEAAAFVPKGKDVSSLGEPDVISSPVKQCVEQTHKALSSKLASDEEKSKVKPLSSDEYSVEAIVKRVSELLTDVPALAPSSSSQGDQPQLDAMYSYRPRYVEREIELFLAKLGDNEFTSEDDVKLTSQHYLGNEATETCAMELKKHFKAMMHQKQGITVLDAGAGLGGTSRHLLSKYGLQEDKKSGFISHVTEIEFNPEFTKTSKKLAQLRKLDNQISHITGDLLDLPNDLPEVDAVISFLTFLHIPNKPNIFKSLGSKLKKGGLLYVEDFTISDKFNEEYNVKKEDIENVKLLLKNEVCADELCNTSEWQKALVENGFELIKFTDMTRKWTRFVVDRANAFEASLEEAVKRHGEENRDLVVSYNQFYSSMKELFLKKSLTGFRVIARKI